MAVALFWSIHFVIILQPIIGIFRNSIAFLVSIVQPSNLFFLVILTLLIKTTSIINVSTGTGSSSFSTRTLAADKSVHTLFAGRAGDCWELQFMPSLNVNLGSLLGELQNLRALFLAPPSTSFVSPSAFGSLWVIDPKAISSHQKRECACPILNMYYANGCWQRPTSKHHLPASSRVPFLFQSNQKRGTNAAMIHELFKLIKNPYDEGTDEQDEKYYRRAHDDALTASGTAFMS